MVAAAKHDYAANSVSCAREGRIVVVEGQQLDIYDCLVSGVSPAFGVRSGSLRQCYVIEFGQPVGVGKDFLRRVAPGETFECVVDAMS